MPKQSQWRGHLAVALSLLSLVTLILAWARPNGVEVPRERATIVVVIDVSRSMAAKDIAPSRLEAAQKLSTEFIKSLPEQYNVAVVSMSGNPAVRLPPTTDRVMVERAIANLQLQDSTAVGDALLTALQAVQMAPKGEDGQVAPGAVVMLSDGANTTGQAPQQATARLRERRCPSTPSPTDENGSVDLDGKRERVPPDREMLRSIATTTQGQLLTAESASDLDGVYKNIKSEVGYEEVKKETTATWAGYGLAFAVVAALAAVSLGGEVAMTAMISFIRPGRLWMM